MDALRNQNTSLHYFHYYITVNLKSNFHILQGFVLFFVMCYMATVLDALIFLE